MIMFWRFLPLPWPSGERKCSGAGRAEFSDRSPIRLRSYRLAMKLRRESEKSAERGSAQRMLKRPSAPGPPISYACRSYRVAEYQALLRPNERATPITKQNVETKPRTTATVMTTATASSDV